jgi:hypothetical protein
MKRSILVFLFLASIQVAAAQEDSVLNGTWSGSWVPKGGVRDSVTVELRQESGGKLVAKFLSPVPMDLNKTSFNAKTGMLLLEGVDAKSGKAYKLNAKVQGTELKGTLDMGDVSGELHLIKWTYVPRTGF